MSYQSGDDPQLLIDTRAALKRWRRPTLGDTALGGSLADVKLRQEADPWLTRSNAIRQTVMEALAGLKQRGRSELVDLLEQRYILDKSVIQLTETYHLSERSIYHRLQDAHIALAHALWAQERTRSESVPGTLPKIEPSHTRLLERHLPPQTYTRLFGMDKMLDQLLEYLGNHDHHWVISLDGMAGLGKTALAREAAGRLAETKRFAGIGWVTIRPVSFTSRGPQLPDLPALSCGKVLDVIADQLGGIDLEKLPLEEKRDRVNNLLHNASYLVVLDNLETAMDCGAWPDWFWGMANPSKFLLTSRRWIESEVRPTDIFLYQLPRSESFALIRHEANLRGLPDVADAGDDALQPILEVTGGNPLAIKLIVGQLVSLPLSQILAALKTAAPGSESFYQYLFSISWDIITPQAQHLLLRLPLLPAGEGDWDDLLTISGLSENDLASAIETLSTHSLLQACGFEEKSYSLHPLTYHFAINQAARANGLG